MLKSGWDAKVESDVLVWCGAHFMSETAKIPCPDKKMVLVPRRWLYTLFFEKYIGNPMCNFYSFYQPERSEPLF